MTGNGRTAAEQLIASADSAEGNLIKSGDLRWRGPVTRKTWKKPGCHPATLYRIDGGGHGWPGGPQSMPARVIGPIAKHLDATGLLLDMAERETSIALGHAALDWGEIA